MGGECSIHERDKFVHNFRRKTWREETTQKT